MASTYSPLLRYELIGSGEQAGVWGNTTNVNLGSLVEQSIAGVTNIVATSLGGTTYTLTALNGAPDEARSMVLNFTGSAASSFTVIVPTSQKLYVVRNSTGQTINFKTAAQVTPQAVDTANSTMIFCDGTNVLPGIAAPSVGTLLVSGGGTGATTFSAGFIKSPGGTTALTSSSSVSLTADVSGILPVANGGTGIASPTAGRLLIGNGSSAMTTLAGTATGNFLNWSGTAWAESALLGTTKGGTGLSAYSTGQIIYASAANTLASLNIGTIGHVLTVSASGLPAWSAPTASGVASFSAGTTGLTPATATTGAVSLAGTLVAGNGGTGQSTYATGDILYASGASALSKLTIGASGRVITSTGTAPQWQTLDSANIVDKNTTQTITGNKTFTGGFTSSTINLEQYSSLFLQADGTGSDMAFATKNSSTTFSTKLLLGTASTTATQAKDLSVLDTTFRPTATNTWDLGVSTIGWRNIYANNAVTVISDQREKTDVENAALGLAFISALRPVSYRMIEGSKVNTEEVGADGFTIKTSIPGVRRHYGLIAQEVKAAVDAAGVGDFAGWVLADKNDPDSRQMLRYEEFISPLIKAVQELSAKVEALEARVSALGG